MEDVIIIGGGASGLMCGLEAARRKKRCIILEQKEKAGKKLYATGNGKCNFANTRLTEDCYHSVSSEKHQLGQVINSDSWKQIMERFLELGIPAVERQGYLYPHSEQAAAVVQALEQAYLAAGGTLLCEEIVTNIRWRSDSQVQILTKQNAYTARKVVLATGGCASPKLGSDGSGYRLAEQIGHSITVCVPALCGLRCKESGWNKLQGVRAKGSVRILYQNQCLAEEQGELQFTQYGVSGIAVFNLSRYAGLAKEEGSSVKLQIDLLPEITKEELVAVWKKLQTTCGYRSTVEVMTGWLPDKLSSFLAARVGISGSVRFEELSKQQMDRLTGEMKNLTISIIGTNTYEQAQVTAGGIPLSEIDMITMASKLHPNCYCIGEILDADGKCGGYNLMWAWETGRRAGIHI